MSPEDHAMELPRYGDWSPTPHDSKGLGLPDRQDWRVMPLSRTRDSGKPVDADFDAMSERFEEIDPDCNAHESHRFNHWGPGWFEIMLVNVEIPAVARLAGELVCNAADGPFLALTSEQWSEIEQEEISEAWEDWARDEFAGHLATWAEMEGHDGYDDDAIDRVWEEIQQNASESPYCADDGVHFPGISDSTMLVAWGDYEQARACFDAVGACPVVLINGERAEHEIDDPIDVHVSINEEGQAPRGMPLAWCNSASIDADPERDRVRVSISVGDPRGAFVMEVERAPNGDLRLSVPTDQDSLPHAGGLTPLASPGYYKIGGQ